MNKPIAQLRWGGVAALLLLLGLEAGAARPRPDEIPSADDSRAPNLRLDTEPYSFQVIERKTARVLLRQADSSFDIAERPQRVLAARHATVAAERLTATLALADTTQTAAVEFAFTGPQVLRVTVTGPEGASGLTEEFHDQGEHVYGLWEYPFGGSLDNRGAEATFSGPGRQPDVNCASASAPFYVTSHGYGVYAATSAPGSCRVAVAGRTGFRFRDARLQYYLLYGPSYAGVMRRYNELAGPAFVPPTWSLGSLWWRDDYHKGLPPGGADCPGPRPGRRGRAPAVPDPRVRPLAGSALRHG